MSNAKVPRVVIAGAGFGGLSVVRALRRAPVAITLIDRENHHTFQPLLYQVATASLPSEDVAWSVRELVRGRPNIRVVMAEITGVDVAAREVRTDGPSFGYDYLVLATGSTPSYFGHDEWARYARGLKRIADATAIRKQIVLAFEQAELTEDPNRRAELLTFVVVGGGATGVELAGAIAEVARDTLRRNFRSIDPAAARIILIEAGGKVIPSLPPDLSDYAATTLGRKGVDVRCNVRVTGCDQHGVDTSTGRIDAATILWTAGVTASPAASWIGAKRDKHDRIEAEPDLSIPGHPEIYAIGDTVAATQPGGKPVPGLAASAKQMGAYVGRRIAAAVDGRSGGAPFKYRDEGELATIGRNAAVVRIGRIKLTGFIGWAFWSVAHIFFLVTLRDRIVVSLTWLWSYVTFQRSARVVTRPGE